MPIMGREWYYWGGNGRRSSKRDGLVAETDHISSGGGCMCAVFQAFDFHPFHFSFNHHQQQQPPSLNSHSSISQDLHTSSVPKGAEAPRNSLESEDGTASNISKEDLKIPKNIRIRTRGSTTKSRTGNLSDVSSEISISSSPGTKTPTLVARLMGLDLLPDANSSSSSSSSCLSTPNQQQGNNNNNNPHLHHHHLKQRKQHIQILMHRNSTDNIGTIRSLPETPRMSLARRSDVEHRLSLQINKENMGRLGEDLDPPRFSFSKRKYDENNCSYCRSPSHYARQIVKQVKDSVSRRVGLDITNTTVKNREQAREELVGQFRFKKLTKKSSSSVDIESSTGKNSNSSYSPRLSRFLETKNKPSTKQSSLSPLTPKDQNTHQVVPKPPSPPPPLANIETTQLSSRVLTKPKPQQAFPEKDLQSQKPVPIKGKKVTNEKFSSRLNKPPPQASIKNKQEESFVTRPPSPNRVSDIKAKSKRTHPLSSNLVNSLNNVPNVLHAKKDPSLPATKISQKQVCDGGQEPKNIAQLSSCSRQKYKQEATHSLATRETSNSCASTITLTNEPNDEGAEFQYITTILTQTGLRRAMLPNLQYQWFSLSHPLDPSIFHNLENYPSSNPSVSFPGSDKDCIFTQKDQLGLRCNRRLLFDLVDELLSEILVRPKCHKGLLLETVWKRVRSFPRAKCEVLEDIDGLIEMEDMKRKMKEEEEEEGGGEGLVVEIGRSILETLVHETVTVMVGA